MRLAHHQYRHSAGCAHCHRMLTSLMEESARHPRTSSYTVGQVALFLNLDTQATSHLQFSASCMHRDTLACPSRIFLSIITFMYINVKCKLVLYCICVHL